MAALVFSQITLYQHRPRKAVPDALIYKYWTLKGQELQGHLGQGAICLLNFLKVNVTFSPFSYTLHLFSVFESEPLSLHQYVLPPSVLGGQNVSFVLLELSYSHDKYNFF